MTDELRRALTDRLAALRDTYHQQLRQLGAQEGAMGEIERLLAAPDPDPPVDLGARAPSEEYPLPDATILPDWQETETS